MQQLQYQPQCPSVCSPQPCIRQISIPQPPIQLSIPEPFIQQVTSPIQPYPGSGYPTGFPNGFGGLNNPNAGAPQGVDLGSLILKDGILSNGFVLPSGQNLQKNSGGMSSSDIRSRIKICCE